LSTRALSSEVDTGSQENASNQKARASVLFDQDRKCSALGEVSRRVRRGAHLLRRGGDSGSSDRSSAQNSAEAQLDLKLQPQIGGWRSSDPSQCLPRKGTAATATRSTTDCSRFSITCPAGTSGANCHCGRGSFSAYWDLAISSRAAGCSSGKARPAAGPVCHSLCSHFSHCYVAFECGR
jgi:hypothetical protein